MNHGNTCNSIRRKRLKSGLAKSSGRLVNSRPTDGLSSPYSSSYPAADHMLLPGLLNGKPCHNFSPLFNTMMNQTKPAVEARDQAPKLLIPRQMSNRGSTIIRWAGILLVVSGLGCVGLVLLLCLVVLLPAFLANGGLSERSRSLGSLSIAPDSDGGGGTVPRCFTCDNYASLSASKPVKPGSASGLAVLGGKPVAGGHVRLSKGYQPDKGVYNENTPRLDSIEGKSRTHIKFRYLELVFCLNCFQCMH
ncbi:unnamed protein product [Protopolystoma xenopodis]|uniref:Uncharacterized protein n=1 Tax=Protopolystoma xenopodis TaxID=117903 RepID=A0A3S5FFZ7_9PLAT|nr:unnamed protein product [Protopolystoma xenopodis]